MRTTVELPDDLFRRAKAEAALRGIKFRELVLDALAQELESPGSRGAGVRRKKKPTAYDLMEGACGIAESGIRDLAVNPKHLERFGRDAARHR